MVKNIAVSLLLTVFVFAVAAAVFMFSSKVVLVPRPLPSPPPKEKPAERTQELRGWYVLEVGQGTLEIRNPDATENRSFPADLDLTVAVSYFPIATGGPSEIKLRDLKSNDEIKSIIFTGKEVKSLQVVRHSYFAPITPNR